MCYSEFNDIIASIGAMDADVISIETARSKMDLLDACTIYRYPNEIGPGEIGHAMGLGHNSDPATLMCGRPAPCRPDALASSNEHYLPLTSAEKVQLLALYADDWTPR